MRRIIRRPVGVRRQQVRRYKTVYPPSYNYYPRSHPLAAPAQAAARWGRQQAANTVSLVGRGVSSVVSAVGRQFRGVISFIGSIFRRSSAKQMSSVEQVNEKVFHGEFVLPSRIDPFLPISTHAQLKSQSANTNNVAPKNKIAANAPLSKVSTPMIPQAKKPEANLQQVTPKKGESGVKKTQTKQEKKETKQTVIHTPPPVEIIWIDPPDMPDPAPQSAGLFPAFQKARMQNKSPKNPSLDNNSYSFHRQSGNSWGGTGGDGSGSDGEGSGSEVGTSNHGESVPYLQTQEKPLSPRSKGCRGEEAGKKTATRGGYEELSCKLPSNQGFDYVGVSRNSDGTIKEVIIVESKYSQDGKFRLSKTDKKGKQMSERWIKETIQQMERSRDPGVRETAKVLKDNDDKWVLKGNVLDSEGINRWGKATKVVNQTYQTRSSTSLKCKK